MKKIVAIILSICLVLPLSNISYAYTVDDRSIVMPIEDGYVYVNGALRNDISNIQHVGNGYLVNIAEENSETQRCFTTDFINFKPVSVFVDEELDPYSRAGDMDEIIWGNGVYMARSNVYDNIYKSGRCLESKGYLYILNEDFQLVDKIEFDHYVREMSYINGIYYVRINNQTYLRENVWSATPDDMVNKVYSSSDLQTWKERTDLQHVPRANGKVSIVLDGTDVFLFENDAKSNQIVYEEVKVIEDNRPYSDTERQTLLNAVGEYFYIVNNGSTPGTFWLSTDGIYFSGFYSPWTYEFQNSIDSIYGNKEGYITFMKKSYINNEWIKPGDVYVKFNNYLLGFEWPPVMENDRTLVPMRFLFEQMGAEVTWDDSAYSATAMLNGTSVTFRVNHTTAKVNGKEVTMDVPARLIRNKTMVPVRFLSEQLGYTVNWDEVTNTVIIE